MAWQSIPAADSSEELAALTKRWRDKQLQVPGVYEVLMRRPGPLRALMDLNYSAMFGASSLGRYREELIATCVSALNRCLYCTVGHADMLRKHWPGPDAEFVAFVRALWELGERCRELGASDAVETCTQTVTDTRALEHREATMLVHVAKLSLNSVDMTKADLQRLDAAGFSEVAVVEITEIACCFAFMNRVANSLGVQIRTNPALAIELFGESTWHAHQARA